MDKLYTIQILHAQIIPLCAVNSTGTIGGYVTQTRIS